MAKSEDIYSYCNNCEKESYHEILCDFYDKGVEQIEEFFSIHWSSNHQLIRCCGCKGISFRAEKWCSEDANPLTGEGGAKIELFPESNEGKRKLKEFENIPFEIESLYSETISAYNAECYRLCAAGLRAVTESICVNLKIKSGLLTNGKKQIPLKEKSVVLLVRDTLLVKMWMFYMN